jgi:CDP-glycerol glycerophosphotransferase (TagB/SpsB family)
MVRAAKAGVCIDDDAVAELAWPKDDSKGDAKKRRNEILGKKSSWLLASLKESSLG